MKKTDKETKTSTYFCDRCEKKFAESKPLEKPGDNKISRGVSIPVPVITGNQIEFKVKDLCGTCVRGLDKWMKGKKDGKS
jgi:hypothetical protein